MTGCGGSSSPAVSVPVAAVLPLVDISSVNLSDPGSSLPVNWQHGAFIEIFVRSYQDSDGNGKIDTSEFEAAFTESLPQHTRASTDEPRLPLLPRLRDDASAADGSGSSRRSARHVVAEMAVQVAGRARWSIEEL